jgi:serine/threonine protein kinase
LASTVDSNDALGLPTAWTGRSGRTYRLDPSEEIRRGGMASIRRVIAEGEPPRADAPADGALLALKLASGDPLARETMIREVETFELLQAARTAPPCPRLHDVVLAGETPAGLVMEWCPNDMELWWDRILVLPDALEPLCGALADICRRIAEYHEIMASKGVRAVHADIKPRNAVLADDGRWLLTDFGAAKSRPIEQETWEATRLILGTENFIAPEMLFNARKRHPQAMDTWSVGATFFALLKMRRHRLFGNELPIDGTHNTLFRCQRMSWVTDLREREPTLFVGQDLDPSAFTSPDQLPEGDRETIRQALLGVFGEPDPDREQQLEGVILALLDRALRIDPASRFTDAQEMSLAFDGIVRRYWELEGSIHASSAAPAAAPSPAESTAMQHEPDLDEGRPTVVANDDDLAEVQASAPDPVAPGPFVAQSDFLPAGQADDQTQLASPDLRDDAPLPPPPTQDADDFQEVGPQHVELGPQHVELPPSMASLGPPPGASPPPPVTPNDTLIPPGELPPQLGELPQQLGELPPAPGAFDPPPAPAPELAPPPTNDRVVQLLEGIRSDLGDRPEPTGKVRLPFWLILAIGLLIFCQTLQFGLLVAIFLGGMGMSSSPDQPPELYEISADELGELPFEPAVPVDDEAALADDVPDRSGDEEQHEDEGDGLTDALEPLDEPLEEALLDEASQPDPTNERDEPAEPVELDPEPAELEPAAAPAPKPAPKPAPAPAPKPAPAPAPKPAPAPAPKPAPAAVSSSPTPTANVYDRTQNEPPRPKPKPTSEPTTGGDGGAGSIEVIGATAYVVGPEGRRPCGDLPAGTYEVFARPNDAGEHISLGVHMLVEGEKMQFRCGFGACRRIQ